MPVRGSVPGLCSIAVLTEEAATEYAGLFTEHEMTGKALAIATADNIRAIGVEKVGHCLVLLDAITKLNKEGWYGEPFVYVSLLEGETWDGPATDFENPVHGEGDAESGKDMSLLSDTTREPSADLDDDPNAKSLDEGNDNNE